ncbi:MAG: LLM class flavin-dependent oxidoreductase [Acidimicrobiales bacterium]|nr:LLM class flavin-dependent oxidoreductase [Acidimicrobiales bacterium]
MFLLRFDMRSPADGAPTGDLYAAALEMASWCESRGALAAIVSEHHGLDDGYLPSPLVLATALAARTSTLAITTAALILPLYDPIRLAEDLVVLDIISGGRVSHVLAVGYRPEEYEQHGVDFARRGRIADAHLALLLRAKTGEPFSHEGRRIHVTPAPVTPGGPTVMWGGGSAPAARRAGRHGLDFFAQGGGPELEAVYAEAARNAGVQAGTCLIPPPDLPTSVFVAHDVEQAWEELGPYLLHDALAYSAINPDARGIASFSHATTVDELRAENRSHRILSVPEAIEAVHRGLPLNLQPLVGGLDPEVAWRYLRIVTDDVVGTADPAPAGPRS